MSVAWYKGRVFKSTGSNDISIDVKITGGGGGGGGGHVPPVPPPPPPIVVSKI